VNPEVIDGDELIDGDGDALAALVAHAAALGDGALDNVANPVRGLERDDQGACAKVVAHVRAHRSARRLHGEGQEFEGGRLACVDRGSDTRRCASDAQFSRSVL
jgi:hypothetical protein